MPPSVTVIKVLPVSIGIGIRALQLHIFVRKNDHKICTQECIRMAQDIIFIQETYFILCRGHTREREREGGGGTWYRNLVTDTNSRRVSRAVCMVCTCSTPDTYSMSVKSLMLARTAW